jgi:hypothetical protein
LLAAPMLEKRQQAAALQNGSASKASLVGLHQLDLF